MKGGRFIWLASQPVDHAAAFASLRNPVERRTAEGVNRWIMARGTFTVPQGAESCEIALAADGRYRLWINGVQAGNGPVRAAPDFARHDVHDITSMVAAGVNQVAVLVHVPGVDLAWYETVRGRWQAAFGDGGLAAEVTVRTTTGTIASVADETWRMLEAQAWRRDVPRRGWGQDFIEVVDARLLPQDWTLPGFDDRSWPQARAMLAEPPEQMAARGWGVVVPFPVLIRSSIPPPTESELGPQALLWSGSAPADGGDSPTRLYEARIEQDETPAEWRGDPLVVQSPPGRDAALMFAFDYHYGRPFIEIEARGGEEIDIAVAEAVPGDFGRGQAGEALRDEGHLGCFQVARYIARPGIQRFERFDATAVRAMQVMVRGADAGLTIRRIGSVSSHYPVEEAGAFTSSDPVLDKLWHVARNTVGLCMHDAWVDCPGREARQWVGDAVVMFDIAALAYGPSAFALHRNFLRQAAESQRQDGLVRMFAPGDIGAEALTICDFTLLWIIGIERYFHASADAETVAAVFCAVERALDRFALMTGANDLLADVQQWHFIEWAAIDRRGESAAINALWAGALCAGAVLADRVGRADRAASWRAAARRCAEALNRRHWDPDRRCYVDAVDPDSGTRYRRVSQHANALMLLFDIVPEERRTSVLDAITDVDRLKLTAVPPIVPHGEAFDEARDIVRANSFFSHFVMAGIARAGRGQWVIDELRRSFAPMLASGTTTLWESFAPAASLCHGFSATPLFQMTGILLGVTALEPGFARFTVNPQPCGLDRASGSIPTPHGTINVAWQRSGADLHVTVRRPAACELVGLADRPGVRFDVSAA